jgi:hypothetical protein
MLVAEGRWRRLAVWLLAVATTATASAQSLPEATPIPAWGTNGPVRTMTRVGDTLFIGGEFSVVGPPTGGLAIADAADAAVVTTTSDVGTVSLLASDGDGGWYAATTREVIGGAFTGPTVLRITAQGTRHPAWIPPTFDGEYLRYLAVEGGRVFVSGLFWAVNGAPRSLLAALDGSTGALLSWQPTSRSGGSFLEIPAIAAANGRIYISHRAVIGGLGRPVVTAVDSTTGAPLPFELVGPPGSEYPRVLGVAGGRLVLSGATCGSAAPGATLCAFDGDGQGLWGRSEPTPPFGQPPDHFWASGDRVYVRWAGVTSVAALDSATGMPLPWSLPQGVGFFADDGTTIYGIIPSFFGEPSRVVAFDRGTGAERSWRLVLGKPPSAIAVAGGRVAFGGDFRTAGGVLRTNLAAIDLRTGRGDLAVPAVSGRVNSLATVGPLVIVAVGGGAPEVFAFAAGSSTRLGWQLVPNGEPLSLAVAGGALYIGGWFSELSGAKRASLAAVSLSTAMLTPWDPGPGFAVTDLTANATTLYASGIEFAPFSQQFARAAAFTLGSGTRLPFNPPLNMPAPRNPLAVSGDRVVATHRFFGPGRSYGISWLHPEQGHVLSDQPLAFPTVVAGGDGDTFVVGGTSEIDGRLRLAALSGRTGEMLDWNPAGLPISIGPTSGFTGLYLQPDFVAVGGAFDVMADRRVSNLAVFRHRGPTAPRRLAASVVGSTVRLQWQAGAPPAATSFVVEAGTANGGVDVGRFPVGPATSVAGSLAAGTYFVRVRGANANGEGPASSEAILTVPPPAMPPSAPAGLTAAVLGGIVTLSWTAAAGNASSYVLDVGTAPALVNIGSLDTAAVDTTLSTPAPPGTYFVRVRAVNAFGSSAPSNEVQIVVP